MPTSRAADLSLPGAPPADDEPPLLGSASATSADRKRAAVVSALLVLLFAVTAPFADRRLATLHAFVPAYDAAVIVLDAVIALLLWAQFRETGERSFSALACGYTFTPIVIAAHGISFPDAFVPGSLIGGSQTTAWLWMVWHGVFPLFVADYSLLARHERAGGLAPRRVSPAITLAASIALALLLSGVTVFGAERLPELMLGSEYRSPETRLILSLAWFAHLGALGLLVWTTRLTRVIDLWIAVVLLASFIDLALSGILVSGRYQLGFYAGRFYGLLASMFVLGLLLRQAMGLQARVTRTSRQLMASEERYRALFESMDEAFAVVEVLKNRRGKWSDFRFLDVNPAFMHHTAMPYPVGKTATELLGTPNPRWAQMYGQALDTGEALRVEETEMTLGRTFDLNIFSLDRKRNRVAVLFTNITERKTAEAALRRSEQHAKTLLAELQHRVRNTLAVVRSIARRTAERSETIDELMSHLDGRLNAFSRVQAAVTRQPNAGVGLKALIEDELLAVATREGNQLRITGPEVQLNPQAAESISLAVHELATNSVKYGALTTDGCIRVSWRQVGRDGSKRLEFEWNESGVPTPPVRAREGFGLELLTRTLPYDLGADTALEFTDDGVRFRMKLPLGPYVLAE